MDICNQGVWYEGSGIMSRVGATVVASSMTLFISLISSNRQLTVLLLLALVFLLLARFTIFPIRDVPSSSQFSGRDSREFVALFALWIGWLAQSILADFSNIKLTPFLELVRSNLLLLVAVMAWNAIQRESMSQLLQRILLTFFWLFISPPLTSFGLFETTPIISVLRVMLVFAAAVVADMRKKRVLPNNHTVYDQDPEQELSSKTHQLDKSGCSESMEPLFFPMYVMTFGWALFVPPVYWSGFLLLSCISVWYFGKQIVASKIKEGGGMSSGSDVRFGVPSSSSSPSSTMGPATMTLDGMNQIQDSGRGSLSPELVSISSYSKTASKRGGRGKRREGPLPIGNMKSKMDYNHYPQQHHHHPKRYYSDNEEDEDEEEEDEDEVEKRRRFQNILSPAPGDVSQSYPYNPIERGSRKRNRRLKRHITPVPPVPYDNYHHTTSNLAPPPLNQPLPSSLHSSSTTSTESAPYIPRSSGIPTSLQRLKDRNYDPYVTTSNTASLTPSLEPHTVSSSSALYPTNSNHKNYVSSTLSRPEAVSPPPSPTLPKGSNQNKKKKKLPSSSGLDSNSFITEKESSSSSSFEDSKQDTHNSQSETELESTNINTDNDNEYEQEQEQEPTSPPYDVGFDRN